MYIRSVEIQNIRSIGELEWSLPESKQSPGWHVIVGDNGSGKSSFLRSIALAMLGLDSLALRLSFDDWLRKGEQGGQVVVSIRLNSKIDKFSGQGQSLRSDMLDFGLILVARPDSPPRKVFLLPHPISSDPDRHIWGNGAGWFCAAYGPFRRLTGGDAEFERLSRKLPRLARFLSIFDERVALTDCLEWLQDLRFQQLERKLKRPRDEQDFLDRVTQFINQPDFLPFQARLIEISSKEVLFQDGNGKDVRIEDLSDGYRSILSLTFELIRQLAQVYGEAAVFSEDSTEVVCEGVVLIDEIDAHLHPTWQRRIGLWFRKHFPNIQFLVSTHSPLVCQAADVGSVYRLPRPGVDEPGGMVEGTELKRLLYGNVLDAYGTEVFGPDVSRSEQSKAMSGRLAELNVKEIRKGLTAAEKKERDRLRAAMPTEALSLE